MKYALFVFYNRARGKQAYLSAHDKKHVDLITESNEMITIFQYSGRGIEHQYSKAKNIFIVMQRLYKLPAITSMILVKIKCKCKRKAWIPLQLNSCNETCRKIAGVEIGWTFNPSHLYYKLLRKNSKTNYDVLEIWRRK